MTTGSRPSEQENSPARNHFATVLTKLLKYLFQIQDLGFAVNRATMLIPKTLCSWVWA